MGFLRLDGSWLMLIDSLEGWSFGLVSWLVGQLWNNCACCCLWDNCAFT